MKDLSSILQRLTRALGKDTHIKSSITGCIKEGLGFDIPEADLELREGVLVITSTPAKNNSIRLKETEILSNIKDRCGVNIVKIIYR